MFSKNKTIVDPVFGFITLPTVRLLQIVEHPYMQRLMRIKQLGLSSFVYPGAQHTRFQHSLGAMHLAHEAVQQLRRVGHEISDREAEGVMIAMLMHDIGHGPFSHVLEHSLVEGVPHEYISHMLMQRVDEEMGGALSLAIQIFENRYERHFLHQLVSSQLDMDRLDYLRRDSFFTGVTEGVIGAARIIQMLNVKDDRLVIEAKGIYSIENYLIARRFMYWQVYLHKTSLAGEKLLVSLLSRAKELSMRGEELFATPALRYFLQHRVDLVRFKEDVRALDHYIQLDDSDIITAIKVWCEHDDVVLCTLSRCFINRQLFKVRLQDETLSTLSRVELEQKYARHFGIGIDEAHYFFTEKIVSASLYNALDDQIVILYKDGSTKNIAEASDMLSMELLGRNVEKNYLVYYPIDK